MEILNCNERVKNTVHQAKKTRRSGKVPGVLYGHKLQNILFEIGEMELSKEILRGGEHGVLEINLNGSERRTLIKEIQREPVTHRIVHIDLEEINSDTIIQSEVPILFCGGERVSSNGGIIQREKASVKVQCKADLLPKYINVDLSRLGLGDSFKIRDIEAAEEITFIDDLNTVIAAVTGGNTSDVTVNNEVTEVPVQIQSVNE